MLREIGCTLAMGYTAPKARIKLMVLLGAGSDREAVAAAFERG